ncbi:MAG: hypothetical protein AAGF07_02115 [Patescibacteria group bacterium]
MQKQSAQVRENNFYRFTLSLGLIFTTMTFIVGVFGLVSISKLSNKKLVASAASVSDASSTAWTKIGGLPQNYTVNGIRDYNGEIYMLTAGYKCDECGLFKFNESNISFDKIAPNPGNRAGDLEISSTGEFYTFFRTGEVLKFNSDSQSWDKIFSPSLNSYPDGIDINHSNRNAHAGTSMRLGPDDEFYATAEFDDGNHYVIKHSKSNNSWEKFGPAIPTYEALSKSGSSATHDVFDPRIAFDSTGTIFVGNTLVTSVSKCSSAPKYEIRDGQQINIQPTNIVMRLINNQWEGLSTKEKGYSAAGYTCGWGRASIQDSQDGNIYVTGGSGQFYIWNNDTESWSLTEQNGYPSNFRLLSNDGVVTSAPSRGGQIKMYNQSFKYDVPKAIENQNCEVSLMRNMINLGDRGIIGSIFNKGNQDCGNGFPSPSTVNGGRKNIYETQNDINSYLAKDAERQFDRGLYYINVDSDSKSNFNFKVDSASYLLSNSGLSEDPTSIAMQDNGGLLVSANFANSSSIPDTINQVNLLDATNESAGKIVKLNNNGSEIASVINLGNTVDQIEVTPDNSIVAIGDFGLALINPEGTQITWSKPLTAWRKARRVSVSNDGKIASLDFKTVQTWNPDGTQIGADIVLTDSYAEDIALDGTNNKIYIGGFNNARRNNVPVQISYIYSYDFNSGTKLNTTWNYNPENLGKDMADTRIYRVALNTDGSRLYATGESAGGNTIYRWNGKDLNTSTGVNSGPGGFEDMWMAKSSAHLGYVAQIDTNTGTVLSGSFNNAVLRSKQRLNTTKIRGDLAVDNQGNVYVTGTSAAHIPGKATWSVDGQKVDNGMINGYAGADPYLLILKPNLDQRILWTTFGQNKHVGFMKGLAIRGNRAGIVSSLFKGKAITTENAVQAQPGEELTNDIIDNRDIFFATWDTDTAI